MEGRKKAKAKSVGQNRNERKAKWNSSVAVASGNNTAIVQENIYQAGNWLKSVACTKKKKAKEQELEKIYIYIESNCRLAKSKKQT